MATIFSSELDGTNGAALTVANSGFAVVTGGWVFDTATKASGTAAAKLPLTAGTGMLTVSHSPNPLTTVYYDFMYRVDTFDGGNIMFAQLKLGGTNKAQLVLNSDGTITMKNGTTAVWTSTTAVTTGAFFRVQWGVNGSTQQLRLRTSGSLFASTPTEDSGAKTYSQASWDSFRVGCNVIHTLNCWADRVVADDATWPGVGGATNVAPVANAGTDQTVTSGATVTLNGTGSSDSDGTIASYAWAQQSGPTATLSSATVASPTFTAPAVTATTDVIFALQVTDNLGTTSTSDTVTISVSPAVASPTDDFFELCNTGPLGAAATTSNTAFDSVDAGITFQALPIGEGTYSLGGAGGALQYCTHILPAATSVTYVDAVFQIDALPTAGNFIYLMTAHSGSTARAYVRVNSDGSLRMRNGTTAVGSDTTKKISAGQPFRIAWHLNNGGNMDIGVFTGANLWGTTPDSGGTSSGTQNTGTFDRLRFGMVISQTVNWNVDSIRVDATTAPAPLSTGAAPSHSNTWLMQSDGTVFESTLVIL